MKLLLILLLISSSMGYSQIPPKANVIVVKGVSFRDVCTALLDAGYRIETRDIDLQTAKTENKVYPSTWNAAYRIHVRMKDSIVYLSGSYTAPYANNGLTNKTTDPMFKDDPAYNLTNRKGETKKTNLPSIPFLEIQKFALSFNKPVEYLVQ